MELNLKDKQKHERWVVKLHVSADERALIAVAAESERMDIGAWIAKVAVQKAKALATAK